MPRIVHGHPAEQPILESQQTERKTREELESEKQEAFKRNGFVIVKPGESFTIPGSRKNTAIVNTGGGEHGVAAVTTTHAEKNAITELPGGNRLLVADGKDGTTHAFVYEGSRESAFFSMMNDNIKASSAVNLPGELLFGDLSGRQYDAARIRCDRYAENLAGLNSDVGEERNQAIEYVQKNTYALASLTKKELSRARLVYNEDEPLTFYVEVPGENTPKNCVNCSYGFGQVEGRRGVDRLIVLEDGVSLRVYRHEVEHRLFAALKGKQQDRFTIDDKIMSEACALLPQYREGDRFNPGLRQKLFDYVERFDVEMNAGLRQARQHGVREEDLAFLKEQIQGITSEDKPDEDAFVKSTILAEKLGELVVRGVPQDEIRRMLAASDSIPEFCERD
ncbi:MAG: hypothetical protein ABH834_07700 [Candidatus Altiarchaeota archaeon]